MTAPLHNDSFRPEFADLAEAMLRERQIAYPKMIEEGKLDRATANRRIATLGAIAEIWRCATDGMMPRAHFMHLTRDQALDELDQALDAAERRLHRRPEDRLRQDQLAALRAMRWWHGYYEAGASYALNMMLMVRYDAMQRYNQALAVAEEVRRAAA